MTSSSCATSSPCSVARSTAAQARRCDRLIVPTCCLKHSKPHEPWERALSIEDRIPLKPQGAQLGALRRSIARAAGRAVGHPPAGFWNMLAQATSSEDILKRLDTLDQALANF